jgi:hypothetical protein
MKMKSRYFFGILALMLTCGLVFFGCPTDGGKGEQVENGDPIEAPSTIIPPLFVAVEVIWEEDVVVAEVGEFLTLDDWLSRGYYRVDPDNATDKTITWSVKDPGSTGATITGNILTATTLGDVIVTATIANGLGPGTPFTTDKTIRVKGPLVPHGDFVVRDILGGVEFVQYLGNEAHVVIPGNLGITALSSWPAFHSTINSLVIPEGVTKIEGNFYECYSLTSVTLPQSLLTFSGGFEFNLESITVKAVAPPSVTGNLINSTPTNGAPNVPEPRRESQLSAIYVPAGSVNAYKNADGWKNHADLITAIVP